MTKTPVSVTTHLGLTQTKIGMIVGTMEVELVLRQARSLKDKRRVVRSLKDRLSNEFNIAVAEIDYQDKHQRIALGIAVVGTDRIVLESVLEKVRSYIERNPSAEFALSRIDFY
jgi:uncharacterized protein